MLTSASTASRSIAASSSAVKSLWPAAARFSSSCATLLAPISTEVTRGSRSAQDSASWASVCPRADAISFSARTWASVALTIKALVGPVGADLYSADLADADLTRANLAGADLARADLTRAILVRADLTRAVLVGTDLQGADLTRADLIRAKLIGAMLCGANLNSANLVRANLYDADLTGANLHNARLTRADLIGADLHDAVLTRADLYGANLTDADLTDADLGDADLGDANLAQVLWSTGTLWPGDMASLMRDRSEELRPGVWQVVGSGNADADTEDQLFPVP
jgi:hypothetical protein